MCAWLTRSQLFWGGNKRTALLAANKLLIEGGAGLLLVPERQMLAFSKVLSSYYESGDSSELLELLYDHALFGIDHETGQQSTSELTSSAHAIAADRRSAAWLKAQRSSRRLTQRQLAQAVGLSVSAIANIEQGQRKGSEDTWQRFERFFEQSW